MNRRTRRSLASELGMKCNAICSAYSDYTSENRREERTIPVKFLLGTSLWPKIGNNSEKAHIKYGGTHLCHHEPVGLEIRQI